MMSIAQRIGLGRPFQEQRFALLYVRTYHLPRWGVRREIMASTEVVGWGSEVLTLAVVGWYVGVGGGGYR